MEVSYRSHDVSFFALASDGRAGEKNGDVLFLVVRGLLCLWPCKSSGGEEPIVRVRPQGRHARNPGSQ